MLRRCSREPRWPVWHSRRPARRRCAARGPGAMAERRVRRGARRRAWAADSAPASSAASLMDCPMRPASARGPAAPPAMPPADRPAPRSEGQRVRAVARRVRTRARPMALPDAAGPPREVRPTPAREPQVWMEPRGAMARPVPRPARAFRGGRIRRPRVWATPRRPARMPARTGTSRTAPSWCRLAGGWRRTV